MNIRELNTDELEMVSGGTCPDDRDQQEALCFDENDGPSIPGEHGTNP